MYTTSAMPVRSVDLPQTAQRRRRRAQTANVRRAADAASGIMLSPRWISAVILLLCAYATFLVGSNGRFFVSQLPVQGTFAYSPQEIADASGLGGQHIFAIDLAEAARNVSALPGVISANVTMRWPDVVEIEVIEREAVMMWEESGVTYWVTENGGLLPAGQNPIDVPRIVAEVPIVSTDTTLATSRVIEDDSAAAQTYLNHVPPELLVGADQLRAILAQQGDLDIDFYYSPVGGLSFDDSRGWRAYFGEGDDMGQKMDVYEAIVSQLGSKGVTPEYVSVSSLGKPYFYAPELLDLQAAEALEQ